MGELVALALGGLVVVVLTNAVARRTHLPASVLLVLAGVGYGYLPGPNLELDPEVVLYLVIPPLLYGAALQSSLTALRRNARTVIGLSVALVLVTALAVGFGLNAVVAAVPLSFAIAVGAAVSPPDPVAALSIGRRAGMSPRLTTLVEGEGLLNDATALTILQVAVATAIGGRFSVGHAVGDFLFVAAGGLAVGMAVAWVIAYLRKMASDPLTDNALSLGTPFAAYVAAESLHVSGVLAVVVAGLWLGHRSASLQSSGARLQTRSVWHLVEYLLEGYVFLLIGQQLPAVVRGLAAYDLGTVVAAGAVTVGIVLLVRPLWLLAAAHLPARMHARLGGDPRPDNPPLSGRELLALSWAGTRGVITLAAAFTLPASTPARDLLLFCAYLVVLVTLVGQGLTFAPLLRRLRLPGTAVSRALTRNEARAAAVQAALDRLTALAEADPGVRDVAAPLRRAAEGRHKRYTERVALLSHVEDQVLPVDDRYRAALLARREMIAAERDELLAWRDAGRLADADMRILERELDHEESVLPPLPPS
ncbi:Na+/H+ antiporter [Micromonospora sp. DT46]|uniref:Na+/H+ antiporter n=1 Tax=unclassified Micromonospora TaxID=2617518 RepID=UPI00124B2D91|nr:MULTISPECIES: Na+/H+ antiporter [unclassified Micromonospora]KAB1139690.1 Na+/H+ antiporter [Micromonospora sp. AMSO12t]WSG00627.1 Na+/H+ antiporter [Micromonospora sp. NBC_01740]